MQRKSPSLKHPQGTFWKTPSHLDCVKFNSSLLLGNRLLTRVLHPEKGAQLPRIEYLKGPFGAGLSPRRASVGGVGAAWKEAQEREPAEGRRRDTRVWGSRRR